MHVPPVSYCCKKLTCMYYIDGMHWTHIYIYMLAPPKKNLCFHLVMREIGQQKHVRAILRVENIPVMVRHRQELYLSRDG